VILIVVKRHDRVEPGVAALELNEHGARGASDRFLPSNAGSRAGAGSVGCVGADACAQSSLAQKAGGREIRGWKKEFSWPVSSLVI